MIYTAYAIDNETHKCYEDDLHTKIPGWIYLHGDVEKRNGYDIVAMDEIPEESGIYHCKVISITGETFDCIFYFWKHINDIFNGHHGLICLPEDGEANKDAMRKYLNKVQCL